MQRPNNIGPYFYNLAPQSQALRIEEFASQLMEHNPGLPLTEVGNALRLALRSMGWGGTPPAVRVIAGALEIVGRGYFLTITPSTITHVYGDA